MRRMLYLFLAALSGLVLALALVWLSAAVPAQAAPAATRQVNCTTGSDTGNCIATACRTIQYAIGQSSLGDTIVVTSSPCLEHITMKDGVSVHGQGWSKTIINGGHTGPTPTVYMSSVGASTVLSGVQVTGGGTGITTTSSQDGGGIAIWYASPTIVNTWVQDNTARNGGGVFARNSSPTFNNVSAWWNKAKERGGGFYVDGTGEVVAVDYSLFAGTNGTVWWNTAGNDGGGFFISDVTAWLGGLRVWWNTSLQNGGGINVSYDSNRVALWLNDISANTGRNGGGISTYDATDLEIVLNSFGLSGANIANLDGGGLHFSQSAGLAQWNWIMNNQAGAWGGGAAVWSASTGLALRGNWFEGNTATSNGGGLALGSSAAPLVSANTFVTNTTIAGGGLFLFQAGAATVTNNILAHNVASSGIGGGIMIDASPGRIVNNTIADNTGDGVYFAEAEGVAIVNNIVSGNLGDGIEHYSDTTWVSPTIAYTADFNDVYNDNYVGLPPGPNDRSWDPQFVAAGGIVTYYHILDTSPISTTGSADWAPARDIDGDLRILDGSVSMGADEIATPEHTTYLPLVLKN